MTQAPVATQSVASLDLSARAMTRPARPETGSTGGFCRLHHADVAGVVLETWDDQPIAQPIAMADPHLPGTPLADHFAEIAAKLREIEADKARERAKPDTPEQPPYYSYGVGDA